MSKHSCHCVTKGRERGPARAQETWAAKNAQCKAPYHSTLDLAWNQLFFLMFECGKGGKDEIQINTTTGVDIEVCQEQRDRDG